MELFEAINKKTKITGEWQDPHFLANLLMELTSYYSTLGKYVAETRRDRDEAETNYKVTKEQSKLRFIDAGNGVGKADSLAVVECAEQAHAINRASYKYELIKSYRESLEKTMDAIRTRISMAKYEMDGNKAS